jgi:ankyrin repeat protein
MKDLIKNGNIEGIKLKSISKEDTNYLHYASRCGQLNIVKYFIQDIGMDPYVKASFGQNTLQHAAECGHLNVVKFLIQDIGMDPYDKTYHCSNTSLHLASGCGYLNVVKYLMEDYKMNPNDKNKYGQNALYNTSLDIIFYFIKLGYLPTTDTYLDTEFYTKSVLKALGLINLIYG